MKLGIFVFASCLSLIANAQQPVEAAAPVVPPVSEIEKFSYLPPLGTTYMDAGFTHLTSKGSVKSPAGTVYNTKTSLTTFNYLFGLGVSDYLALGLRGRILMTNQTDYEFGPASTVNGTTSTFKRSGWEEPELGAVWRIRNNTESKMRAHLNAGVRPKIQNAKFATATSDGNAGIGGTQFNLGVRLFKEVKDVELQVSAQRNFLSVVKSESASDSTKTTEDGEFQTTDIRIGVLGFTSETLTLGGNLVFHMEEKHSVDSITNNIIVSTVDMDSGNSSALELIGKLKVEANSLLQLTIESLLNSTQSAKVGTIKLDQKLDSGTAVSLSWIQEF